MRILAIILLLAGHVFLGMSQLAPSLSEKSYPIDPNSFLRTARKAIAEKEIQPDDVVLRSYFKQVGIELSPPSSFSVNYEAKLLIVRSTRENLAKIEALLPPPPPARYERMYNLGAKDLFYHIRRSLGSDQSDFDALHSFLKQNGVDLSNSLGFYSEGKKMFHLWSTL